ncbi:hypothetical protein DDI_3983 [Dickeya dianthicola RNS04.9]|nr:hypothetical protein DDI_3983 [Dickeya dianthicola RNS04.9]
MASLIGDSIGEECLIFQQVSDVGIKPGLVFNSLFING